MKHLIYLVIFFASCTAVELQDKPSVYDELCESIENQFDCKVSFSKSINLNISDTINTLIFQIDSIKDDSPSSIILLSKSSLKIHEFIQNSRLQGKILNIEIIAKKGGNESNLESNTEAYLQIKEQIKIIEKFFKNYKNKNHKDNYLLMDSRAQGIPDTTFISYFEQMQNAKGPIKSWKLSYFTPEKIRLEDEDILTNTIIFEIICENFKGEAFFRLPLVKPSEIKILGIEI